MCMYYDLFKTITINLPLYINNRIATYNTDNTYINFESKFKF